MNQFELTGRARTHVVEINQLQCTLHYEAVASLLAMRDAAVSEGIELAVCSSFRDFDTQLSIWNRKWAGERPLFDRDGAPMAREQLNETQIMDAILCWSALPGASRHHWGSDVDLFDRAAMPEGYKLQLLPQEYAADGVFARLTQWLDTNMHRFGFYRPYAVDHGGVSPEPWHLSYVPVAVPALESMSLSMLRKVLQDSDIAGKQQVLARLPEIYTRYLLAVDSPA